MVLPDRTPPASVDRTDRAGLCLTSNKSNESLSETDIESSSDESESTDASRSPSPLSYVGIPSIDISENTEWRPWNPDTTSEWAIANAERGKAARDQATDIRLLPPGGDGSGIILDRALSRRPVPEENIAMEGRGDDTSTIVVVKYLVRLGKMHLNKRPGFALQPSFSGQREKSLVESVVFTSQPALPKPPFTSHPQSATLHQTLKLVGYHPAVHPAPEPSREPSPESTPELADEPDREEDDAYSDVEEVRTRPRRSRRTVRSLATPVNGRKKETEEPSPYLSTFSQLAVDNEPNSSSPAKPQPGAEIWIPYDKLLEYVSLRELERFEDEMADMREREEEGRKVEQQKDKSGTEEVRKEKAKANKRKSSREEGSNDERIEEEDSTQEGRGRRRKRKTQRAMDMEGQ